jgi:hypothetical protein
MKYIALAVKCFLGGSGHGILDYRTTRIRIVTTALLLGMDYQPALKEFLSIIKSSKDNIAI